MQQVLEVKKRKEVASLRDRAAPIWVADTQAQRHAVAGRDQALPPMPETSLPNQAVRPAQFPSGLFQRVYKALRSL